MEPFEKVINPGRTAEGQVFVKIEWDGKRLSLSGVVGPLKSGHAKGSCGQIAEELFAIQTYAKGWTHENSWRLVELWRRWHSNDMQAGCEHQRALKWTAQAHLSEPCPTCGYQYGSAWLHDDVPEDILAELRSLPDTTKQPAWV